MIENGPSVWEGNLAIFFLGATSIILLYWAISPSLVGWSVSFGEPKHYSEDYVKSAGGMCYSVGTARGAGIEVNYSESELEQIFEWCSP